MVKRGMYRSGARDLGPSSDSAICSLCDAGNLIELLSLGLASPLQTFMSLGSHFVLSNYQAQNPGVRQGSCSKTLSSQKPLVRDEETENQKYRNVQSVKVTGLEENAYLAYTLRASLKPKPKPDQKPHLILLKSRWGAIPLNRFISS